jgi:hypothetical protein
MDYQYSYLTIKDYEQNAENHTEENE